jgi:hypothetical protein
VVAIRAVTGFSALAFWIGDKVAAIGTIHSGHSGVTILLGCTRVYAASFSEKMFQYRGKEARIERGRECLGRDRKEPVEKVLPRGMKEGVSCLQRFSRETEGLPGLELGKRVCLGGFWRALNRYSITSHLRGSLINAISHDDIKAIIHSQVEKVKQGDTAAAKFILERLLGRPQTMDLSLVAIRARIEEMRAESDEVSQKEIMTMWMYI